MAYIGVAVAFLGLIFAMFKYFESRMDRKFDKIELKFDGLRDEMNELRRQVFDLALVVHGNNTGVAGPAGRKRFLRRIAT